MEKLGSTVIELSRLNHLIYNNFLRMLNSDQLKKENRSSNRNMNMTSKDIKWKLYARKLENELKEIQNIRIKTKLENELVSDLQYYSFSSKETIMLTLRLRVGSFEVGLSRLRQPGH
jgi:hypothetical protein